MFTNAFVEYLAAQLATGSGAEDTSMQNMYFDYLDKSYGKLSENHNGMPIFKDEWARRQFTIAADATVRAYRSGKVANKAMDAASTTTSTGTTNANLGVPRVILPLLRRIMPALFVQNLVGIQALTAPDAKIFYYTPKKHDGNVIGDKSTFSSAYADKAEGLTANNVTFELATGSVTTKTKKLAAQYSFELMTTADVYVALDVEKELVASKAEEINLEIEAEIINMLAASASAGNVDWHSTAPVGDVTSADKKAYDKTLYNAIIDADTNVFKKTYVRTTWIIAGVDFFARLQKLEDFKLDDGISTTAIVGRQRVGTLASRWVVYVDPFFYTADKALLGFKSPNKELYSGAMFCPYIPAFLSPTVMSPTDFIYSKGFLSWNGMKMINGDMYATVTVL